MGKLEIIYQVTDSSVIQNQLYPDITSEPFYPLLIWRHKYILKSFRVVVPVYQRLYLYMVKPRTFTLYVGPGFQSPSFFWYKPGTWLYLPTFQSLVVLVENNEQNYNSVKVNFKGIQPSYNLTYVLNGNRSVLPPCPQHTFNLKHCLFHIYTSKEYVNLSISRMMYKGSNFEYKKMINCPQGGVAFSLERQVHTFGMKHLCDNYSSNPSEDELQNNYDKPLMNIISTTRMGLFFIVYSFEPYSEVFVEATVSGSPCRGVRRYHPIQGKLFP